MKQFLHAKFIKTAMKPKDYPVLRDLSGDLLPEIAVAGRSNVGKSSLLNHLFHTKHLVKTSSVPGKTQALNFFTTNEALAFVDLPGYGYANVSIEIKKQWGPMIKAYLENRKTLKLILLLLDIRRVPNDEDRQLIEWAAFHDKAVIIILTKVDKVNQNEKRLNTKKILESLKMENLHYLYYSVPKNIGRKELMHMIQDALQSEAVVEEPVVELFEDDNL